MPTIISALDSLVGGLPSGVRNGIYLISHYVSLALTLIIAIFANSSVVGITIPDRWSLIVTVALAVLSGLASKYMDPTSDTQESFQPPVNDDTSAPDPVATAPDVDTTPAPMEETPAAPNAPVDTPAPPATA